jgi:alkanesulfonate monooxygenase SsuD/methylene tetrahydromethanopterin reductase-like flavin-dependent oxidoreductase (luciferase family)
MLSRTQPRPESAPEAELWDIQNPIIDAYLAALAPGKAPRIMGSRSVIVADDPAEIRKHAQAGLDRFIRRLAAQGRPVPTGSLDDILRGFDVHLGTPAQVIESLSKDTALARATEVAVQVHSVDPPHELVLRSIELFATEVAPALGWSAKSQAKVAA